MGSTFWNIITRNIQPDEQAQREIRQKLARLEEHLKAFPPDKLHLQVLLEKHPKKPLQRAELTLRLPTTILRSEKSAPELMAAFDDALQILLGELESGKGGGQRGALRKRDRGGEPPQAPESAGFAAEPQAQGIGPQDLEEVIREFLQPLEQMVEKVLEPQVLRTEEVVPNPEAVPPDRVLEEKELLEELQGAVQSWPRPEREAFELYFVQGFEPEEIARITGQPLKQVKDTLATVQRRLRKELLQEEARIAA